MLLGAGGHAKVVAAIARRAGWTLRGVLDDGRPPGTDFLGVPVLGPAAAAVDQPPDVALFVAIGDNATRARLFDGLRRAGRHLPALVDPDAELGGCEPGPGTVVMAGALVLAGTELGANCILNTRCLVGPECRLEDHVHLCPGTCLESQVWIGVRTMVGTGSVILAGCRVGADCKIGAGSLVDRDLAEGQLGYGRPLRVRS